MQHSSDKISVITWNPVQRTRTLSRSPVIFFLQLNSFQAFQPYSKHPRSRSMGGIFSRSRKDDFESILASLEDRIVKGERRLNDLQTRQQSAAFSVLIYGLFVWGMYAAIVYLRFFSGLQAGDGLDGEILMEQWLGHVILLVLGIPCLHYTRVLTIAYYRGQRKKQIDQLKKLTAEKTSKLEELKKKTAFYETKNLLEKYEARKPPTQQPLSIKSPQQQQQQQRPQHGQQQPVRPALPPIPASGKPGAPQQPQQMSMKPMQQQKPALLPATGRGPMSPTHNAQRPPDSTGTIVNAPLSSSVFPTPAGAVPMAGVVRVTDLNKQVGSSSVGGGTRAWYDRLVDKLVGEEESPENKYALICKRCFEHNGLVLPEEIYTVKYRCPVCKYLNEPPRNPNAPKTTLTPLPVGQMLPALPAPPPSQTKTQSQSQLQPPLTPGPIPSHLGTSMKSRMSMPNIPLSPTQHALTQRKPQQLQPQPVSTDVEQPNAAPPSHSRRTSAASTAVAEKASAAEPEATTTDETSDVPQPADNNKQEQTDITDEQTIEEVESSETAAVVEDVEAEEEEEKEKEEQADDNSAPVSASTSDEVSAEQSETIEDDVDADVESNATPANTAVTEADSESVPAIDDTEVTSAPASKPSRVNKSQKNKRGGKSKKR
ncbi:hypothetical protein GQ42DRAFT_51658 [Ramicandelaber brevisporus]|nr:hypothetical protein GQ42DRAFT_51658 [Ramicandelaber brevisporus]